MERAIFDVTIRITVKDSPGYPYRNADGIQADWVNAVIDINPKSKSVIDAQLMKVETVHRWTEGEE